MVRSEGNMSLKNPATPPGIDAGTVRLVAQRLNHYANPDTINIIKAALKYFELDRTSFGLTCQTIEKFCICIYRASQIIIVIRM
jgi:hypothetical protein